MKKCPYCDNNNNNEEIICSGCGFNFKTTTTNTIVQKTQNKPNVIHLNSVTSNVPHCPVCNSSKIHKISTLNKVGSVVTFGILATGHVSKTFKCDSCGMKF